MALERARFYPHAAADGQVRMRFSTNTARQTIFQPVDFGVRQGRKLPVEPYKADDTRNLQHTQAIDNGHPNKYVSRKKRELQSHSPVLPPAHRFING